MFFSVLVPGMRLGNASSSLRDCVSVAGTDPGLHAFRVAEIEVCRSRRKDSHEKHKETQRKDAVYSSWVFVFFVAIEILI